MAFINRKKLSKKEKKGIFFESLEAYLDQYKRILLVEADNVGSNQIQCIRKNLRGRAVVLMGKNTMIRKCLRNLVADKPDMEKLLPLIRGNIGFVFTNEDPASIRDVIRENRVAAPARIGAIAPVDVWVQAGPTGMEPTQTSFLQALDIPSKINRGQIEIVKDVHLLKIGDKVGSSEATLLKKLGIAPFHYGLEIDSVYDEGSVYAAAVLDLTDDDLLQHIAAGVTMVTALSLAAHFPTVCSVPHSIMNGYKNVLAVSLATEYEFEGSAKMKEYLANPEAFAAAAAPVVAEKKEDAEEEKEESGSESDDGMGMSMFD